MTTRPSSGTSSGPKGTRNGRARPGSLKRRTMIPMQTRMNAKSVPMFVRSTISSMFTNVLHTADEHAR